MVNATRTTRTIRTQWYLAHSNVSQVSCRNFIIATNEPSERSTMRPARPGAIQMVGAYLTCPLVIECLEHTQAAAMGGASGSNSNTWGGHKLRGGGVRCTYVSRNCTATLVCTTGRKLCHVVCVLESGGSQPLKQTCDHKCMCALACAGCLGLHAPVHANLGSCAHLCTLGRCFPVKKHLRTAPKKKIVRRPTLHMVAWN